MGSKNRNYNYKRLRDVGYSVVEAHKYKDRKESFIQEMLERKVFRINDKAYVNFGSIKVAVKIIELNGNNAKVIALSKMDQVMLISTDDLEKEDI